MFISRVKAKGNFYFYAYIYDNSSPDLMRTVYSLGKRDSALQKLNEWKDSTKIPSELIELGLTKEKIPQWIDKIQYVQFKRAYV